MALNVGQSDTGFCGYAITDDDGEQQPCDRPTEGWRWYQDTEHEDMLDVACYWHMNEGGRRMHAAEAERDELRQVIAKVREAVRLSRTGVGGAWPGEACMFLGLVDEATRGVS